MRLKANQIDIIRMQDFDAYLTRKKIKYLYIRINREGIVQVSAPLHCPLTKIKLFLQKKTQWIIKHRNVSASSLLSNHLTASLSVEQSAQMAQLVPVLINKWAQVIGVEVNQWVIKVMKTRWGSCQPVKKKICLNAHLIQYPLICLEYVIVHELVHLLEASHNARFHALMTYYMPEWKEYKRRLT